MLKKPQSADDWMKWIIGGSIAAIFLGIGIFIAVDSQNALTPKEVTVEPQGETVTDEGRDHVENIGGATYDSNPPTSGKHFALWAKRGAYPEVLSDGYLIHSLEHGYINLSYNCGPKGTEKDKVVYKEGDKLTKLNEQVEGRMSPFTPETAPAAEIELSQDFTSDSCQKLVNQLSIFLKEYQRIVIVPRPSLDTTIAATAWGRIDKMDTFDEARIRAFIAEYHNKGPERTAE